MAALPRPVIDTPPTSPAIEPVSVLVASATTSTPPPPLMLNVGGLVSFPTRRSSDLWRLAKLLKVTLLVPPLSVYAPLVPVMADQRLALGVHARVTEPAWLVASVKKHETLALEPL